VRMLSWEKFMFDRMRFFALIGAVALGSILASPVAARPPFDPPPVVRPPFGTPEIDPGMMRGTLTVLVGGMVILLDRRRRHRR
jgi:hypothetical protein